MKEPDIKMAEKEKGLIVRAQNGDHYAFEQLVSNYDRQVLNLAYSIVGSIEDAQDIYQEALISAYKALPKFKFKSSFFTWIYKIAVNKSITFKQKMLRTNTQPIAQSDENSFSVDNDLRISHSDTPEQSSLNSELKFEIENAILNLSAKERMAFVLCHQQGHKIRETAELMDCTTGTVKSYLFRAREKLKSALKYYMES